MKYILENYLMEKKVSDSKILYFINSEEIIYFKKENESTYDKLFKKL